ncbi:hypothetical protein BASA81_009788 [Batrachochytrium salamandrivorans]|nr:hypothetical protein BASA81_009788 [Batrachochytrium salamandrivorans]
MSSEQFGQTSMGSVSGVLEQSLDFCEKSRPGTGNERGRELNDLRAIGYTRKESDGVYWAIIRIGSPVQQSFSVIVDTGSSSIAVPCKGCDCGLRHHQYDAEKSTSVQKLNKRYNQCYSEGSCNSGELLSDLACFGDKCTVEEAVRHSFGCCSTYAPAFKTQDADGIIGLSGSSDTLVASLRTQLRLHRDMFSICFGRTQGLLTVGGVFHRPLLEGLQYVPLVDAGRAFYSVNVMSIIVGSNPVASTSTQYTSMLDSGSTFTYFPRQLHANTRLAVQAFCQQPNKCRGVLNPSSTPGEDIRDSLVCYSPPTLEGGMTVADWLVSDFPQLAIQFDANTRMCLSPKSYFFKSTSNVYCIGIFPDRANRMVIGAISMADFTVAFDTENHRVGFAKANCDGDAKRQMDCCGGKCAGYTYVPPSGQTLRPTMFLPQYQNPFVPGEQDKQGDGQEEDGQEEDGTVVTLGKAPTTADDMELDHGTVGSVGPPPPLVIAILVIVSVMLVVLLATGLWWARRWCCSRGFSVIVDQPGEGEEDDEENAGLQAEKVVPT